MTRRKRVLAVSSGGGHWVQLQRVISAFDDQEVIFVTVNASYQADVPDAKLRLVSDSTRWDRFGMIRLATQILWILVTVRPHLVISTGAAPGFLAIVLGRLTGSRTIWLDSIANVEEMSMSGRMVRRFSHLWLTQWPHLACEDGPEFAGRVF